MIYVKEKMTLMNDFFIEKKDFSEMYKKLLHQYLLGNLPLLEMSKIAVIANKYGFKLDYNFNIMEENRIEKQNNCDCSKYYKIIGNDGFICSNCGKNHK